MSFAQRFALVVLAAFFISTAATSLAGFLGVPAVVRASARLGSTARAWVLAGYRLLPAVVALAMTAFVLGPGYFRHEQRGEPESAGLALVAGAVAGLCLLLVAAWRVARAIVRTARLRRQWMAEGERLDAVDAGIPAIAIDTTYPLVAVLGVIRPRLFISRSVLDSCTAAELAAIVEHERRHVSAFDNATRVAMDAAPDLIGYTPRADALAREWHHAVEHRADDAARHRLDLAAALVRVARMAGSACPTPLPASALYRGDGIEDRVKRLVARRPDPPGPQALPVRLGAALALLVTLVAAASLSSAASEVAHTILEAIVSLP